MRAAGRSLGSCPTPRDNGSRGRVGRGQKKKRSLGHGRHFASRQINFHFRITGFQKTVVKEESPHWLALSSAWGGGRGLWPHGNGGHRSPLPPGGKGGRGLAFRAPCGFTSGSPKWKSALAMNSRATAVLR